VTPLVAADLTENGELIYPPVFNALVRKGTPLEFRKDVQCWENLNDCAIIIIIIIITDLYSAFRSEDTEALDAAQED